jgi:hypothetical protein
MLRASLLVVFMGHSHYEGVSADIDGVLCTLYVVCGIIYVKSVMFVKDDCQ